MRPDASTDMHHVVFGAGAPTLVFVHGFACALEDWRAVIDRLSTRWRCVALDLPGHGGTALAERSAMADQAAAVNAVREAVGPGPQVLVGHSLGVRVIVDAYLARPDDVAGLVFVDGRFYDGDAAAIAADMNARLDEAGFAAFMRAAFAGMFTARSDAALRDRVVARAATLDPAHGRALLIESILWDSRFGRDRLRRIGAPLLHLQSSDLDAQRRMTSLQPGARTTFMRLVETLVPTARVEVVPDIGHFAALEAPDAVARAIERFLVHDCKA